MSKQNLEKASRFLDAWFNIKEGPAVEDLAKMFDEHRPLLTHNHFLELIKEPNWTYFKGAIEDIDHCREATISLQIGFNGMGGNIMVEKSHGGSSCIRYLLKLLHNLIK